MNYVRIEAAQDTWAELMSRVEAGEEFALVRRGAPVAYLLPRQRTGAARGELNRESALYDLHSDEAAIAWE